MKLSSPENLLPLTILGIITGILSGSVIVIFRILVEGAQSYIIPSGDPDGYEELSDILRFLIPVIGGFLLAALYLAFAREPGRLGIARVIERISYKKDHFTVHSFFLQFFGAAIAIIFGHSVGREGPHVYLGSAISAIFAELAKLPRNILKVVVACGSAAGIAASFNTPLAGMIFALEVVLMEFSISTFVPVILAAAIATVISNEVFSWVYDKQPEAFFTATLDIPPFILSDLPYILILGVIIGSIAALFNHSINEISRSTRKFPIWQRLIAAGFLMGVIGWFSPSSLGVGYDTINSLISPLSSGALELTILAIAALIFFKFIATCLCIGLSVPAGMIAPSMFLGAAIGFLVAVVIEPTIYPEPYKNIAFFALLGMGAMMGASLQAPLAALTAILELTHNSGLVMPAMITIVSAQLTTRVVFNKKSLFVSMLEGENQFSEESPISQTLRGLGVTEAIDRNFIEIKSNQEINKILSEDNKIYNWIVLSDENSDKWIIDYQTVKEKFTLDKNTNLFYFIKSETDKSHFIDIRSDLHDAKNQIDCNSCPLFVGEETKGNKYIIHGIINSEILFRRINY